MYDAIPTQPRSALLTAATLTLIAVLLGTADLEVRLAVGGALATLNNVHPPYPPLDDPEPLTAEHGLALAAAQLEAAIDQATTAQEAIRIGFALRHLLELDQPDI